MFVGRGFGLNCAVNCNTTLILLFYTLPSTYTLRPPFSSTTHLFVLSQRRVYRFIPPPPRANSSAHNLCGPQGVVLMSKASSSIMARSVMCRATGVGCSAAASLPPPPASSPSAAVHGEAHRRGRGLVCRVANGGELPGANVPEPHAAVLVGGGQQGAVLVDVERIADGPGAQRPHL